MAAPRRVPLRVQNLRINNVEVPTQKRIEISLQYIYGIGQTSAKTILRDTGVENKKSFELNEEEINKIREEVGKYTTESDLVRDPSFSLTRHSRLSPSILCAAPCHLTKHQAVEGHSVLPRQASHYGTPCQRPKDQDKCKDKEGQGKDCRWQEEGREISLQCCNQIQIH